MQPMVSHDARSAFGPDLSLGRKLALGFATLTILSLSLGGLAMNRMGAMNRVTVAIRDNYIPSTLWSGKIGIALEQVGRLAGSSLLAPQSDMAEQQKVRARLDAAYAGVEDARRTYDPLIDAGEERDRYTHIFDQLWPRFRADSEQAVALHDSGHGDAAERSSTGRFAPKPRRSPISFNGT